MVKIGETLSTMYGSAKVEKINAKSVIVIIQGPRRMKMDRKMLAIMNPASGL